MSQLTHSLDSSLLVRDVTGDYRPAKADEVLQAAQRLNVRRMKSDLQIEVLESFVECAGPGGGGIDENLTTMRVSQIATRPDLWDKVFKKDKDLKRLDVLVIPITDDPSTTGGMRQVAYVRPGAKISSVVQGSDHVQLVLPDWMQIQNTGFKRAGKSAFAAG